MRSRLVILKEWDAFGKKQKCGCSPGFPGGSVVKNPPAIQELRVRCLGWEDFLEEEMATHSRILAWRIPWIEKPGRLQSMGLQRVGSNFHFFSRDKTMHLFWGWKGR